MLPNLTDRDATQARIQCLEMANRQHFHADAQSIVAAAQRLYDFAIGKQPSVRKAKKPLKRTRR